MAHHMSPAPARVLPQLTAWEALSMEPLPPVFWLEINDDAMQPDIGRGDFVELDTRIAGQAEPGDVVLVRTGAGEHFIREYRAAHAGAAWTAAALNRAYDPLDYERDDLTVVAVLTNEWRCGRRSRRL
jgi:SOS-response transcriptional repressor LexA